MERDPLVLDPRMRRQRLSTRKLSRPETLAGPAIDAAILKACAQAMNRMGGRRVSSLGVTSSVSGEGRTLISTAIALVQSREYGRPTLLIDTSFERPALARHFDLPEGPGLAQVVSGRASVEQALHPVQDGLTVMPAGEVEGSASRLATEFVASNLLNELKDDFQIVIGDLPAMLESTYAARLAEAFEEPLLIVRARVTPISTVRSAMSQLEGKPTVLLNGTESRLPRPLRRFFT